MIAAALLASASIFHGTPVTSEQAPWLVTLTTRAPFCGGALIAPDRVLTAAHCVQGADPGRVSVRIHGVRHAWRGAYFPTSYREIASPVNPEDPSASGTVDDIAVIVLAKPVTGVPVLPVAGTPPVVGEVSQTIGTGRTGSFSDGPRSPHAANQTVSDACPAAYGARLFFPAKHLCTLDGTPNASQACAGDSGSPVMVMRDGNWAVAGVVTWGGETYGRDCGEGLPDVSERIDAHTALLTATGAFAPYAERRVRVRRSGEVRRCVIGAWHPTATFKVRWWRRSGTEVTPLSGHGRTRRGGPAGCSVTATTAGGWAREDSYNQL
ncbi:S1 family peptidase [Solirubrobacter soli]|uniref:S1 family peptidase n=1 Tax=Solirubrobacter soli TaxID=363832 RepID=UPI000488BC9D|nr:trypsin-like serine protease [Solirubrobacter soli]